MSVFRHRIVLTALAALMALTASALAKDKIYLDFSGIDARTDLTADQKTDLKNKVKAEIDEKFPDDKFEFTTTPNGQARTVKFEKDAHDPDDRYGEWPAGGDTVTVYVGAFMDDANVSGSFKTDGSFDMQKLANALGETAAHELGHSYSVGHNTHDPPDIMTDGSRVTADKRAEDNRSFDAAGAKTRDENLGKKPCKTATDYDTKAVESHIHTPTSFGLHKNDEGFGPGEYVADAQLFISGPPLPGYYFGYIGEGQPDGTYEFLSKSSLEPGLHMPLLTWFQFDQEGISQMSFAVAQEGSPNWMHPEDMVFNAPVQYGDYVIYRQLTMFWPTLDLVVQLDAGSWDPNIFNGWAPLPPCPGDLDGDGDTDQSDLGQLLGSYGVDGGGDLDGDGDTDQSDLGILLGDYGCGT